MKWPVGKQRHYQAGVSIFNPLTHHFDVVEPLVDQLLRVLPVGCVLWHRLHWCQNLWVQNPQTLRKTRANQLRQQTLLENVSVSTGVCRWGVIKVWFILCGVNNCMHSHHVMEVSLWPGCSSMTGAHWTHVWCLYCLLLTSCGLLDTARPTRPVVWKRTAGETLVTSPNLPLHFMTRARWILHFGGWCRDRYYGYRYNIQCIFLAMISRMWLSNTWQGYATVARYFTV